MHLWLVIPAWRRFAVSRLAFAQQARLRDTLAARGITAQTVVIADDTNLILAREHGFRVIEQTNLHLGRKVNDGIEYACERGADWVAFIGSDDWLHADAADPLVQLQSRAKPPLVAGHTVTVVDLERQRLRKLGVRGPDGVSPWFIPRWMLERSGFRPAEDDATHGMEGSIRLGLPAGIDRIFHDPHDHTRVDFKTGENMTPYRRVADLLGVGRECEPWAELAKCYPLDLVALAYETSRQAGREAVAA